MEGLEALDKAIMLEKFINEQCLSAFIVAEKVYIMMSNKILKKWAYTAPLKPEREKRWKR